MEERFFGDDNYCPHCGGEVDYPFATCKHCCKEFIWVRSNREVIDDKGIRIHWFGTCLPHNKTSTIDRCNQKAESKRLEWNKENKEESRKRKKNMKLLCCMLLVLGLALWLSIETDSFLTFCLIMLPSFVIFYSIVEPIN